MKKETLFAGALTAVCMDVLTTTIMLTAKYPGIFVIERNPIAATIIANAGFVGLLLSSTLLLYVTYKLQPHLMYVFLIGNSLCAINNAYLVITLHGYF